MAAHAGDKAQKTGDFHCTGCNEVVHVTEGKPIPKCHCGATEFDQRRNEPGNKSSSPSGMKSGQHRSSGS